VAGEIVECIDLARIANAAVMPKLRNFASYSPDMNLRSASESGKSLAPATHLTRCQVIRIGAVDFGRCPPSK